MTALPPFVLWNAYPLNLHLSSIQIKVHRREILLSVNRGIEAENISMYQDITTIQSRNQSWAQCLCDESSLLPVLPASIHLQLFLLQFSHTIFSTWLTLLPSPQASEGSTVPLKAVITLPSMPTESRSTSSCFEKQKPQSLTLNILTSQVLTHRRAQVGKDLDDHHDQAWIISHSYKMSLPKKPIWIFQRALLTVFTVV